MRQMHLLLGLLGRNFYASLREKSNDLIVVFDCLDEVISSVGKSAKLGNVRCGEII